MFLAVFLTSSSSSSSRPVFKQLLPTRALTAHQPHRPNAPATRPRQINKHAFSGGGATLEEHRARGANLDVDVPWKYLNFLMEDDDKLAHIGREYGAGRMLTGEVKAELIRLVTDLVARHQAARAQVTEEVVDAFMAVRPMHEAVASAGRRR